MIPPQTDVLDIEPPPPPPAVVPLWWVSAPLLLALLLAWLWRRLGPGLRRRRRLARLRRACARGELERREAVFRLAALLRDRLGVGRLSPETPLPAGLQAQRARWQAFAERLSRLRYAREAVTAEALAGLFREAAFWLRGR